MMPCPHGGNPLHWIADSWWLLILALPGARIIFKYFGYRIKEFCCGHREVGTDGSFVHCEHEVRKKLYMRYCFKSNCDKQTPIVWIDGVPCCADCKNPF